MVAYNSAQAYDGPAGTLYENASLQSVLTLFVNGVDRTSYLRAGTLRVRTSTQGTSLGTLDAELYDLPALPVDGQLVALYIGTTQRYRGAVRATKTSVYKAGHTFAGISCQDDGPDLSLPVAAPWGLSDTPNGTTTHGYVDLERQTRSVDGGTPLVTYVATVREAGLWANQLINVTSAAYGLSATAFTILDVQLTWTAAKVPEHKLTLGDPLVRLDQLVTQLPANIAPGAITSTQIADGAISTPKLDANAVVANVANIGGTVTIDSSGIEVASGAITVRNVNGDVIIDGNSDIFRIRATGTLTTSSFSNPGNPGDQSSVTVATGLTFRPVVLVYMQANAGTESHLLPRLIIDNSGHALDWFTAWAEVSGSNNTKIQVTASSSRGSGTTASFTFRYYILEQIAF